MMDSMMDGMIKRMPKEKREAMMVDMMPMMMEGMDMNEFMPKMMTAILPTMLPELMAFLSEEGARTKLLGLFATIMPNVCEVLDKPKLAEKKDALLAGLMSHEIFREKMPKCFTAGFPIMFKGFVDQFYHVLSEEEIDAFIIQMTTNLTQGLTQGDKERLLSEIIQS